MFIVFGVCGLIVQTLLLRVLLSWFNESRVLVIGESLQPPMCIMCPQRHASHCCSVVAETWNQQTQMSVETDLCLLVYAHCSKNCVKLMWSYP